MRHTDAFVEHLQWKAKPECVQVCAGVRSKHLTSSELAEMPPESIPAGEFKVPYGTLESLHAVPDMSLTSCACSTCV